MPTIRIPLHSRKYPGLFATIDEEDYPLVSQYRWNVQPGRNTFYAVAIIKQNGKTTTLRMHRLIYGETDLFIDHVNGDGLTNTRDNLRAVTNHQNLANRPASTKGVSRFTGVSWRESGRRPWMAYIGMNGRPKYLGCFATEEGAAQAYDAAAIKLHGEHASLNFPRECIENVERVEALSKGGFDR